MKTVLTVAVFLTVIGVGESARAEALCGEYVEGATRKTLLEEGYSELNTSASGSLQAYWYERSGRLFGCYLSNTTLPATFPAPPTGTATVFERCFEFEQAPDPNALSC